MDNLNNKSLLKIGRNDFFEKISKSEIFTTNTIDTKIFRSTKLFVQMESNEKKLVLESLKEISVYNKDFALLLYKYLKQSLNTNINLQKFKHFIRFDYSGYYKKAVFLYVIRFILTLAQILILYLLDYPKNICIDEPCEQNDKKFWIFADKKYKKIIVKRDKDLYLRTIIFFIDFILYISEGIVLAKLQRIKCNKCLIITIQILKYYAIAIVIINNLYYISDKTIAK